jgi:hypothetical protein
MSKSGEEFKEHLSGYQRRDYEVVDYHMYELEGTGLQFRGPPPANLQAGQYFTCIGAAQTFGCFCEHPFPALLSARLGLPVLNLGYGGAGPEFFERHGSLDRYINGGQFVVIQVMSGRSQSNSLFESRGLEYLMRRSDGDWIGANAAYSDLLNGIPDLRFLPSTGARSLARRVLRRVLPLLLSRRWAAPTVRHIVEETRSGWIKNYSRLFARIKVPSVLFWFSKRPPAYIENLTNVETLFGEFPQLVNSQMLAELRPLSGNFVECITSRGSPHRLTSRFTGKPISVDPTLDRPDLRENSPWSHDPYYPSPEMHQDAAEALLGTCSMLAGHKVAI